MNIILPFVEIFDIYAEPKNALRILKGRPKWGVCFTVCSLLGMLISYYTNPFYVRITQASFENIVTDTNLVDIYSRSLFLGTLIYPIKLFLKLCLCSILLGSFITLVGQKYVQLRSLFILTTRLELILLLGQIINLLLLYIYPLESTLTIQSMDKIPSLGSLLKSDANLAVSNIFSQFNSFSLWYMITLYLGINIYTDLPKNKALIVVLLYSLSILSCIAAIDLIFITTFRPR